jgi:anti-sigma regulatory factor (Ser/Thr protein kinase)
MVGQHGATVVLEAATNQVAAARRFVRQAVTGLVPDDVAADLQLIVSELFTNAVQYGASRHVSVTVDVRPDEAGVTVDSGSAAPDVGPVDTWRVADETEISGRGLGIVRRLADVVRVERDAHRFTVAATRTFPPSSGTHPDSQPLPV